MKKQQLTPNRVITIVSFFLLLTIDAGFYSNEEFNGTVKLVIAAAAAVVLVISRLQKTLLSNPFFNRLKRTFLYFVLSLIMPILYGRYNTKQMIIMVAAWSIGYLFTLFVSYEEFKELFYIIIRFLAVYSLVTFVLSILFPNLMDLLPYVERNGTSYHNAVFSIVSDSRYVTRNFGVFWEPGAYSIYLNVALYFELFENKFNPQRVILLVVTILSTLSTLGIICMAILFCAFLTTDNKVASKRVKTLVLIAGAFGLVFLVIYGGDFIYHVFNKLSFSGNTMNDSTAVRINAIIYPFNTFLSEPYFGVGYDQYMFIQERFCDNMATCTFINWLCLFGIVGGIIPIVGCLRFFTINNHKFITNCALFVFTMFLFSTENFIIITFIYILIFYGFNKRNEVSLLRKMV